jgi:hypothetical protein
MHVSCQWGLVEALISCDAMMTSFEQAQEKTPLTLDNNTQLNLNGNRGAPLRKVRKKNILTVKLHVQLMMLFANY